jgi:alcohol dehydrogenase, propanol-preferring
MLAFRFIPGATGGASVAREIIPIPTPKPDQCLVKILAAGVCHSDCSILDEDFQKGMFAMPNPFVLGHEGAGTIVSMGSDVVDDDLKVGTHVSILGTNACYSQTCHSCSIGLDNTCTNLPYMGFGAEGFFASYVAVAPKDLVPVPPNVSPAEAAIATDAVLTPWHSLVTSAQITPNQTVLIVGAGGLGLNAIQIAKHCIGVATVVVTDVRDQSIKEALRVGADYACKPEELEALISEHKFLFDSVVDVVGVPETFNASLARVRIGGVIQIIGMGGRELPIPLVAGVMKHVAIKLSAWGCKSELKDVLAVISQGKVKPQVDERPLEDCLTVLHDLASGKLRSRVALIP